MGVLRILLLVPLLLAGCTSGKSDSGVLNTWRDGSIEPFVPGKTTQTEVIRDLGETNGIDPWPLYWALLWSGTLGSNLTIAGAPALYVALSLGEKEDAKKWSLKQFLSFSVPYVVISLVVCYVLMVLIWVVPFM